MKEKTWHSTQKLTSQPDGSLIAQFHLTGIEEIKHWILSFGRYAEAIEPPQLRDEIVEEIKILARLYGVSIGPAHAEKPPSDSWPVKTLPKVGRTMRRRKSREEAAHSHRETERTS